MSKLNKKTAKLIRKFTSGTYQQFIEIYKKLLSVHKGCKITQRRLQSKITDLENVVQNIVKNRRIAISDC